MALISAIQAVQLHENKYSKAKSGGNIVVTPADKGRSTVVMDREIHDQKIQELLLDERVYNRLQKDPLKRDV